MGCRLLPVGDVLVRTLTALLAVGAVRNEIVGTVLTRRGVFVFVAPRIRRYFGFFPIRSVPVGNAGRRRDQRLQSFLRRRIAADLQLKEIERLADLADLDFRRVRL